MAIGQLCRLGRKPIRRQKSVVDRPAWLVSCKQMAGTAHNCQHYCWFLSRNERFQDEKPFPTMMRRDLHLLTNVCVAMGGNRYF
jgi:hypothetical protein